MVECTSFSTDVECILTLTNEYNIKILVLTTLLIYSIVVFYLSKSIDAEKSYMHFWAFYLSKVLPILYIVFSPLLYTLLLSHTIGLELFIPILIAFYLMGTALFIGIAIYSGSSHIWKMFGYEDWSEFKDKMDDRKSFKKYG